MAERPNRKGLAVTLAAVLVLLALGFVFRERLVSLWVGATEATEASPEVAAEAQAKLDELRPGGDPVRLSAVELTSLLRYRAPAATQQILRDPAVRITGDTLHLTGMVPTDRLPSDPNLDRIRLLLPDTAKLEVRGTLEARTPGRAALEVRGIEFAGIPIPARFIPGILQRVVRSDEPARDPAAVEFRLPPRVGSARLSDGYLVLTPVPE